jgi:integrase/recombinase XerD
MLKLMLFTGLRIGNITMLKFKNIEGSQMTLSQTKHGSVKRKHLKTEIAKMLKQYIVARRNKYPLNKYPSGSEDFLFMTKYAGKFKPYSRLTTNLMIKKLAREVGITKSISNHSLRHSFAVRFLGRGGSLIGLKNYLGHRSIRTTEIYTHLNNDEMIREVEQL